MVSNSDLVFLENKIKSNLNVDEINVDVHEGKDKYTLEVSITFPDIIHALDDEGTLWYICNGIDLQYYIDDDGVYNFYSNDENIIRFLRFLMEENDEWVLM